MHVHDHGSHGADKGLSNKEVLKNIKFAVFLNFSFSIIEVVAGLLTNSMAILSDAIHDLGDTVILSFSYFAEKYAGKKTKDEWYTYGLSRLPLLSAFASSLILLVGSIFILYNAIPRLLSPADLHVDGMMITAIFGVAVNTVAMLRLKKNEGINSRVLTLHFLEDVLGWASVLVVSIVMKFWYLPILDPVLSIVITLYILLQVFKSLKSSIVLFIQKAPADLDLNKLRSAVIELPEVTDICDLHVWTLDSIRHVMSIHVIVKDEMRLRKAAELKSKVRKIAARQGDFHCTIEIEHCEENCPDKC